MRGEWKHREALRRGRVVELHIGNGGRHVVAPTEDRDLPGRQARDDRRDARARERRQVDRARETSIDIERLECAQRAPGAPAADEESLARRKPQGGGRGSGLGERDGLGQERLRGDVDDLGVLPNAGRGLASDDERAAAQNEGCGVGAAAAHPDPRHRASPRVDQQKVGARLALGITAPGQDGGVRIGGDRRRGEAGKMHRFALAVDETAGGTEGEQRTARRAVRDRQETERNEPSVSRPAPRHERARVGRQGGQLACGVEGNLRKRRRARRTVVEGLELDERDVVQIAPCEALGRDGPGRRVARPAGGEQASEKQGSAATLRLLSDGSSSEMDPVDTPVIERLPAPFGKFTLRRRLARGGMAEVFLAALLGAEGFEKELVVKLIRPDLSADEGFVRRFVDEAKTCVRLAHPNIVTIFELGVEHGVLYMVMELVRGVTLAELLHDSGALAPDEGAYLALELARALDHAHRRGVIHRDVTPGNVMIDEEGSVKLLDFGIAAPVHGGTAGEVFGTPGHMPPEQLEGRRLSPATDLFALGTVLVEAWSGRAPFRRADAQASRTAMLERSPPAPSGEHAELAPLDDLVLSMLAQAADRRPQHAEDVARRLRTFLRERGKDLDEVARSLARKVAHAISSREARAAGRPVAAPAMPRSIRPTPLAEGTRTFATRAEIAPEIEPVGPSTRKLEDAPEGTRRLEDTPPSPEPTPQRPRSGPWIALTAILGIAIVGLLVSRMNPPEDHPVAPPPSATTTTTTPMPVPSPVPSSTGLITAPPLAASIPSASTSVAPIGSGRLVVASTPPSAVEVDGKPVGQTPYSTTVSAGDHRVVLKPRGLGERFERTVQIAAGGGAEIRGDFNDEPTIVVRKLPSR